jgi:hypothetical protein
METWGKVLLGIPGICSVSVELQYLTTSDVYVPEMMFVFLLIIMTELHLNYPTLLFSGI